MIKNRLFRHIIYFRVFPAQKRDFIALGPFLKVLETFLEKVVLSMRPFFWKKLKKVAVFYKGKYANLRKIP